jgi:Mn2+/Fe2+ NRAMP family transporter
LLWAVVFSVGATIVLQESAARITQASGLSLGELIARRYSGSGYGLRWMLWGALALGCCAYEAGNFLGALAGLRLLMPLNSAWTPALALLAMALLWSGRASQITIGLGLAVAVMGLAFAWLAFSSPISHSQWIGGLIPQLPEGSLPLVMALIGTTIVPYNLFLASGLRHRQSLRDMRWGIALSVLIGGGITLAIMVAGIQVKGEFGFEALAQAAGSRMGAYGPAMLGIGLFAAGFTSAVTAPLAAAIAARTLLSAHAGDALWHEQGRRFRGVWLGVLVFGLVFAWLDVKPIPAIIAAQALNALILPIAAAFLLLAVNDRLLLPEAALNNWRTNVATLAVVGLATFLGLHQLWLAVGKLWPAWQEVPSAWRYGFNAVAALVLVLALAWQIRRR